MLNGEPELPYRLMFRLRGLLPPPPSTSNHFVRWHSPHPGAIKINFDGSLKQESASGGFILRDWTGRLIKAGAANYGNTSILVAEARVLRDGVRLAIQEGFKNIIIEGDNLTVIKAIQGNG